MAIDQQWQPLWSQSLGGAYVHDMVQLADGFLLLAKGPTPPTGWGADLRLIRTDCEGNVQNPVACATTSAPAAQSPHITLYPNPSQGQLRLELPAALTRGQLRLYDATGRLLGQYPLEPGPQVLDLRQLSPGLLLYELEAGDYRQRGKVWLQR